MLRELGHAGCLVGMSLLLASVSHAKDAAQAKDVAAPAATPSAKPAPTGSWPKTLEDAKAEKEAQAEAKTAPSGWAKAEIEAALARCKAQLNGLPVVTVPADPIKQGGCGTPAPVQLISIGQKPQVVFNPPATVTCDMVVALHTWLKDSVQPLARKHLGAAVTQLDVMSDYSCRAAYGRKKGRLSEHARANALDIRSFITTSGETAALREDWGMTAREIRAQVAAAEKAAKQKALLALKAETEKAEAARKAAAQRSQPPSATQEPPQQPEITIVTKSSPPDLIGTLAPQDDDKPFRAFSGVFGQQHKRELPTLGLSKLGGPKEPSGPKPSTMENKAMFLRGIHAHGCKIFGTVLGPEANEAHRDHFHVDMAERELGSFCE